MKCGRCNKELGRADSSNASYIKNPNDKKTFGDFEYIEFTLTDENGNKEKSVDYNELNSKSNQKKEKILTDISSLTSEIDSKRATKNSIVIPNDLEKEGLSQTEKEKRLSQKETLENEISTKETEIEDKKTNLTKIKITSEKKVKQVPKTLVICKDCKKENDELIW